MEEKLLESAILPIDESKNSSKLRINLDKIADFFKPHKEMVYFSGKNDALKKDRAETTTIYRTKFLGISFEEKHEEY